MPPAAIDVHPPNARRVGEALEVSPRAVCGRQHASDGGVLLLVGRHVEGAAAVVHVAERDVLVPDAVDSVRRRRKQGPRGRRAAGVPCAVARIGGGVAAPDGHRRWRGTRSVRTFVGDTTLLMHKYQVCTTTRYAHTHTHGPAASADLRARRAAAAADGVERARGLVVAVAARHAGALVGGVVLLRHVQDAVGRGREGGAVGVVARRAEAGKDRLLRVVGGAQRDEPWLVLLLRDQDVERRRHLVGLHRGERRHTVERGARAREGLLAERAGRAVVLVHVLVVAVLAGRVLAAVGDHVGGVLLVQRGEAEGAGLVVARLRAVRLLLRLRLLPHTRLLLGERALQDGLGLVLLLLGLEVHEQVRALEAGRHDVGDRRALVLLAAHRLQRPVQLLDGRGLGRVADGGDLGVEVHGDGPVRGLVRGGARLLGEPGDGHLHLLVPLHARAQLLGRRRRRAAGRRAPDRLRLRHCIGRQGLKLCLGVVVAGGERAEGGLRLLLHLAEALARLGALNELGVGSAHGVT